MRYVCIVLLLAPIICNGQELDFRASGDCQSLTEGVYAARLGSTEPKEIQSAITAAEGATGRFGDRVSDIENIGGVLRIWGLNYSMCANATVTGRRVSAQTLLTKFWFTPIGSDNTDKGGFSWDFVGEEFDQNGGYRQNFRLLYSGRPVIANFATVHLSRAGNVTALSSSPITKDDYAQLSALYASRNTEKTIAELSALLPFRVGAQQLRTDRAYLLTPEGRYQSVVIIALSAPQLTGSKVQSQLEYTTRNTRYVFEAHSGALVQADSSLADPSRFDTAPVVTRDSLVGSRPENLFYDPDHKHIQLAGPVDVDLKGFDPGSPVDHRKVVIRVLIDGSNVTNDGTGEFKTNGDPARDAAVHAYWNVQKLVEVLANPLRVCGVTGDCSDITANITTAPGSVGEYRVKDSVSGLPRGLDFGRLRSDTTYGSKEMQLVGHEIAHAIVRERAFKLNPLLAYDGCANKLGEPYFAVEESLADTLGIVLSALALGQDAVYQIGHAVMPKDDDQWRDLKDPTKGGKFKPGTIPSPFARDSMSSAWKTMAYAQPSRLPDIVKVKCNQKPTPDYFDEVRYINMGPINALGYALIDLPAASRPVGFEDQQKWYALLASFYVNVAFDTHCWAAGSCTDFCIFKEDLLHQIRHSDAIVGSNDALADVVEAKFRSIGFYEGGITSCGNPSAGTAAALADNRRQ